MDYLYNGCDYDYESYACNDEYCGCQTGDDLCRSSRYEGLYVDNINYTSIFNTYVEKYSFDNIIDLYCLDRILRLKGIYNKDKYNIETQGGYYGEEVEGIYFTDQDLIDVRIEQLKSEPDDFNKIEYVLYLEYGFLQGSFANFTKVSIENVSSEILYPTENMKIQSILDYSQIENIPIGIYYRQGNIYKLIDGRHRWSLLKDKKDVTIICLS